jgi:glycosyltransferase involved in cell wall biosynthesis
MRPKMLSENIDSVLSQTCQDIEQLFLVDHKRSGIQAADKSLYKYREHVLGDFVYILDDDCWLINPSFVGGIKAAAEMGTVRYGLFMVESRRPPGPPSNETIFPTRRVWNSQQPVHGTTNCLCYVANSTLWKSHIHNFGTKPWGGDWWFLEAMLHASPETLWIPGIVSESRQLGRGRPDSFETSKDDWFQPVAEEYNLEHVKGDVWRLPLWQPQE